MAWRLLAWRRKEPEHQLGSTGASETDGLTIERPWYVVDSCRTFWKYGPRSRKRNLKSLVFILNKLKHNHSCNQHYCCRIHGTVRQRDIDRFCDDIRCCFEYPWTSPWKKSCNVYSNVCMKCFTMYLVRNDLLNQCNQSINVSKPWDMMSKIRVMALASGVSYRLSISGRSKFERNTYTCSHYMYM